MFHTDQVNSGCTVHMYVCTLSDTKNYLRSTLFTFCANHKEVKLSFNEHSTGLTLQNINALLSPPNECCNMWVNLESRYGTCPSRFFANAPIDDGENIAFLQKLTCELKNLLTTKCLCRPPNQHSICCTRQYLPTTLPKQDKLLLMHCASFNNLGSLIEPLIFKRSLPAKSIKFN